jgi:hypothetical protein
MTQKTEFHCYNRHCRAPVEKPGRCEVCAKMWARTCEVAQEALRREKLQNVIR